MSIIHANICPRRSSSPPPYAVCTSSSTKTRPLNCDMLTKVKVIFCESPRTLTTICNSHSRTTTNEQQMRSEYVRIATQLTSSAASPFVVLLDTYIGNFPLALRDSYIVAHTYFSIHIYQRVLTRVTIVIATNSRGSPQVNRKE